MPLSPEQKQLKEANLKRMEEVRTQFLLAAQKLADDAIAQGVLVKIDIESIPLFAMGRFKPTVEVRFLRDAEGFYPDSPDPE